MEDDAVAGSLDMDTLPHAVDVVVVSTWFMLREIEIAGARVKDIEITTATVSLDIPLHKTAQGGQSELTRRSFRCVCSTARQPLCPRCAADRHYRRLARSEPGAYLFPGAGGQQRTKLETAGLLNMVLSAAGWQTIYTDGAGPKGSCLGDTPPRVAGATFLALRGVPVAVIQLIGRWSSTAVERYRLCAGAVSAEKALIPAATATHYVMNLSHPPAAQARRGGGRDGESRVAGTMWMAVRRAPILQAARPAAEPVDVPPVLPRHRRRPGGAGGCVIIRQLLLHKRRHVGIGLRDAGLTRPNLAAGVAGPGQF